MLPTLQILIADADTLVHAGLEAVFAREADMQVVGHACNGEQAVDLYSRLRPDVLILDIRLADLRGRDVIAAICRQYPDACILVLSSHDGDEAACQALRAGARGFHLKEASLETLLTAVRQVYAGQTSVTARLAVALALRLPQQELTPREYDVLMRIVAGQSNAGIARALCLSEGTVKAHVHKTFNKLGVQDRTQAVIVALRRGFVQV